MILLLLIAYLEKVQLLHRNDPKSPQLASVKPSVLRSLFTVGLFCKHFDMDTISSETKVHNTIYRYVCSIAIQYECCRTKYML